MRVFGQSNRDDMPKKAPPISLQAMLLMQSSLVTDRVRAKNNSRVEQLLEDPPRTIAIWSNKSI